MAAPAPARGASAPGEAMVVRVFLLDNSAHDVSLRQDGLVSDLIVDTMRALGFAEASLAVLSKCLAICECLDGATLLPPLPLVAHVQDVAASWKARCGGDASLAKFVLRLRLWTPGVLGASGHDAAMRYLLFVSTAYDLITGALPVTAPEEATSLAALLLTLRVGAHDPAQHPPGCLAAGGLLRSLLPAPLLPSRSAEAWDVEILARHSTLGDCPPAAAQRFFVEMVEAKDAFGCACFAVKQRFSSQLPVGLLVGINAEGVVLLDKALPGRPTLQRLPLAVLQAWSTGVPASGAAGDGGVLLLQVTSDGEGAAAQATLAFETATRQEAAVACELLNDYAAQLVRELVEEEKVAAKAQAAKAAALVRAGTGSTAAGGGGDDTHADADATAPAPPAPIAS